MTREDDRLDRVLDQLGAVREELAGVQARLTADDPYTRIPRRPWDLTGTRWEGRDCEMQPLAWIDDGLVPGCEPARMDGGA